MKRKAGRGSSGLLALVLCSISLAAAAPGRWQEIDFRPLVDGRRLTHTGQSVDETLRGLAADPNGPGAQGPSLVWLEPVLERFGFVLPDALDAQTRPADPPFFEIGALYPPGAPQPAWAELLRSRALIVETNGEGKIRAFVPATAEDGPDSSAAACSALDRAWPRLRHPLEAERRRLAAQAGNRPEDHPLTIDAFPFRADFANARFILGDSPCRRTIQDTLPSGQKPPLSLRDIQAFLEKNLQLEGARLTAEGRLDLFGSPARRPVTLLSEPVTLADLAVAYRAVFHGGAGKPFMSLDRGLAPQQMQVNYGGRLQDTSIGFVSLLSDARFKTFSQGIDPMTGLDLRDKLRMKIGSFRSHVERQADDPRAQAVHNQSTRFWFYPDAVELTLSPKSDLVAFSRVRMSAASERVDLTTLVQIRNPLPPWTEGMIREINTDYDEWAAQFPELGDLDEVVRLLSLFTWLQEAQRSGLIVPDLDALLTVELPARTTPRTFPQLLAFHALPAPGAKGETVLVNQAEVVLGLDRLLPHGRQPVSARERLGRAIAGLEPRIPEQKALAQELRNLPLERMTDDQIDSQAFRAERLTMHQLSLTRIPQSARESLLERIKSGEELRIVSLGIGGIDLNMSSAIQKARRSLSGIGLDWGGLKSGEPAAPSAAIPLPATGAGEPRSEWRVEPEGLAPAALPSFQGPRTDVHFQRLPADGKTGNQAMWEWTYHAGSPDRVERRIAIDPQGKVRWFERTEEGRRLRFEFRPTSGGMTAALITVPPPAPPPSPAMLADMVGLELTAPSADSPALTVRFHRTGQPPLEQTVARTELIRLQRGPNLDPTPRRPLNGLWPFPELLGPAPRLIILPAGSRLSASAQRPGGEPGEEEPERLAEALSRWILAQEGNRGVAVAVDRKESPRRYKNAPAGLKNAALLMPGGAFPTPFSNLQQELARGWNAGPVVQDLAELKSPPPLVVLVSAEPPTVLTERVLQLRTAKILQGKALAVFSLAGPLSVDLAGAALDPGVLAELGIGSAGPVGQKQDLRTIARFGQILSASAPPDRRPEDIPSPFTWFY